MTDEQDPMLKALLKAAPPTDGQLEAAIKEQREARQRWQDEQDNAETEGRKPRRKLK